MQGQPGSLVDSGPSRSRCYLNGAPTSLRILRELGAMLVDANAQDSAQALRWGLQQAQEHTQVCYKPCPVYSIQVGLEG